ncbi:Holliday junction branch migration protein RuvA [Legionella yabuuchiae]|uniref:Holliday junction branch migration protein RuvA n=1 Tax=Legionella yabuuchiae TaxID=376727 RepID=UPI001056DD9E|nr:Holliday junction branch migration protein RuvA [Legionella yabuuchiae]
MIGWLKGQIIDKNQPGKLVVDVNGVGYDVETSLQTFFQVTTPESLVGLHIHTVVREDALLLYGFLEEEERTLFRALIKVNGVGPKLAIAILSSITPAEFVQCIQNQDAQMLTRLPGIGKKTAERLVVEMKDSLKGFSANTNKPSPLSDSLPAQDEAIKALESLGYKIQEATKAVKRVDDGKQTCEQLIRQALQVLSSR